MKLVLNACFFRSDSGNEPVREWLKALSATERRFIGYLRAIEREPLFVLSSNRYLDSRQV